MIALEIALVAAVAAFIYYLSSNGSQYKNLPPGPKGLPIIGSLLQLTRQPHLKLSEWVKDYGSLFWLKVANYRILMIADAQLAREAFSNAAFLGKPEFRLFDLASEGKHGMLNSIGEVWIEQRRVTLRHLRDFGFGKSAIHELYMNEVTEFVDWLKTITGKSVSLNQKFGLAAVNSLWVIMTGKRFRLDDKELEKFIEMQNKVFQEASKSPLAVFFPNIAQKIPNLSGWTALQKLVDEFKAMMQALVREHMKEFEPGSAPRDFIDAYLNEIENCQDEKSSFYKKFGEKNLEVVLGDLFGAGTTTTAETLSFALMFLTKYPEIQRKLQEEIDAVVGQSRAVTLEDRKNMPFVEALIMETLRKSSFTPYGIFHSAIETSTLAGFTIPKDTWIGINMYYIHHDPKIWGDPNVFRPERFLSPDGSKVVKNDALIPFSVGKRMCIGEQLAKDGIFLFLTNILQKYTTSFDPNMPEPNLNGVTTLFTNCEIFNVILKERV